MDKLAKGLIKVFLIDYKHLISKRLQKTFELDIEFIVNEAVEEEQKEKRILIHWLQNLTRKIMRRDEFKGLRGYPITHFIEKYQSPKQ